MTNPRLTRGGVILCPQPSLRGHKLTNLDERAADEARQTA